MITDLIKVTLYLLALIFVILPLFCQSQGFRGFYSDLSPPDCIRSNGRRGKCYSECNPFSKTTSDGLEICEFSQDQRFKTFCCDELPFNRFSLLRTEDSWSSNGLLSPSKSTEPVDFECGVRIANKDILEVISSKDNDPNDQGQLLLKALTYLASRDGTHPWMAALWYKSSAICGASIINRRTLLTSAHCFKFSREPADYTVTMGSIYLVQGRRFQVKRLILHERYRPPAVHFDIALIILDTSLRFDWRINPVCLSSKFIGDSQLKAIKGTVTGFGNSKPNLARILQEITVPLLSSVACSTIYSKFRNHFPLGLNNNEFICAGYLQGGKDACLGDSGGPLTIKHYSKVVQIGIVTYGYGCALPDYPGVYTNIAFYYSWIQENSG